MIHFIARRFPRLAVYLWLTFSQDSDARWARTVFRAGLVRRWSAFRRGLTLGAPIFDVRDVLTVTKMTRNQALNLGSLAAPANGAAFTQTNGQSISVKRASKFLLLVYNSKAGAIIITVKAGTYPPAEDAGLGDFTYTCPTTAFFTVIGPLDGSRFLQAGGLIFVDTDAAATGTMWAVELPN